MLIPERTKDNEIRFDGLPGLILKILRKCDFGFAAGCEGGQAEPDVIQRLLRQSSGKRFVCRFRLVGVVFDEFASINASTSLLAARKNGSFLRRKLWLSAELRNKLARPKTITESQHGRPKA